MIIADGTIFAGALRGEPPGLKPLVDDLWRRRELTTHGVVLAELIAGERNARHAEHLRAWSLEAPPVNEGSDLWTTAGDLAGHLAGRGTPLGLTECVVLALCVREAARLWTLNPAFEAVLKAINVERFTPAGL